MIVRPLHRASVAAGRDGGSDAAVITEGSAGSAVPGGRPPRATPATSGGRAPRATPATSGGRAPRATPGRRPPGAARRQAGPDQLEFSRRTGPDGDQVVSVSGELDIVTAEQAYAYLSEVIEHAQAPVSVDLGGLAFCDASGLGVLARAANRARQAGRQLRLVSPRPSLVKIIRITGLDRAFPELRPAARPGSP